MAASPIPIGEVFANKYRVDRVIGEGGMGIVVAAHHLDLDQPVAVKFLLDDVGTGDESAERFRREARAAAKIQSDHVVRVLDVGVLESGERYMVMEYMEGRDLAEELAERGSFPFAVAAGFILEAIDAVGHAHAVGIVHRDLKPANLFLANRPDGSQRVKVLDFGISKSVGNKTAEEMSLTKTSAWIGSPLYMAPEQMQSARDVDHRADVWSLGAILFELIAGRPPYEAESLPQLCNKLITEDPPQIQTLVPSVPDGLATTIMSCLTRDKDERLQNTRDLATSLVKYATTITGSEIRQSQFDPIEVPSAYIPSVPGGAAVSREGSSDRVDVTKASDVSPTQTSGESKSGATVVSSTNAAWGATDDGKSKTSGKLGLLLAALAGAGIVGFFMMSSSGGDVGAEQAPVVASDSVASDDAPDSEQAAEVEPPEPETPAAELQPPPAPEKPEKDVDIAADPKPEAKQPQPKPRAARPRPVSKPAPAPAPKKEDDFADFGGRR